MEHETQSHERVFIRYKEHCENPNRIVHARNAVRSVSQLNAEIGEEMNNSYKVENWVKFCVFNFNTFLVVVRRFLLLELTTGVSL